MDAVDIGAGRGWLDAGAARSLARIDRHLGRPCQVTEAGRTWARQKQHWDTYQRNGKPIALHPDTPSIHQLGNAIDTDEWPHLRAVLEEHGWKQTVYRNGKLIEPWHFEYSADRDHHINDTITLTPILEEEEMHSVRTPNGKIYGMATGSLVHYRTTDQSEISTNVTSIIDETHHVSVEEFTLLCDGLMIPRDKLDADGNVWNPEANDLRGGFEVGGAWSWARENLASNRRQERVLAALQEARG